MLRFARNDGRKVAWIASGLFSVALGCLAFTALTRAHLAAPKPTLIVTDRHGAFITQVSFAKDPTEADYGYWPLERAPDRVVRATLALEDR
ncbi:MAG: glycosyl transferase, partial [Hyphomicrobiales bacterium]|nr:glycosyl transferase [Hyphomicrobiales bacterium]